MMDVYVSISGVGSGGGMVKVVLWLKTGDIDDWGDI